MKLSNVIGYGISGVICAGLVMACADGRGTNGFKSYQYSKAEREQNKLKRDGAKPAPAGPVNTSTDDTAPAGDVGTGTSQPQQTVLPPAPAERPAEQQPLFTAPDAAKGKVIGEPGAQPAPEPGAQPAGPAQPPAPNPSGVPDLTAKVADLNVTIEAEIAAGQNAVAKELVKGITVLPTGTDQARKITIQAMVVINGKEVVMDAADVPVKHLKDDERVPNILFNLTKPCEDQPIPAKNLLQAGAKCRDELCRIIDVILSFETQDPQRRANAIFVVSPKRDTDGKVKWAYVATNIGKVKPFVEAQQACAAPVPANPAPGQGEPPATTGTAPAPAPGDVSAAPAPSAEETARLAKEKAEREAADAARCEEVKKEGFSCDDSPGEIARMRNARAEAARKEREKQSGQTTPPAATAPAPAPGDVSAAPAPAPGDVSASPVSDDQGTDADTNAVRADGR